MMVQKVKDKLTLSVFILIFLLLDAGIISAGCVYCKNYEQRFRAEVEHRLSAVANRNKAFGVRKESSGFGGQSSGEKGVGMTSLISSHTHIHTYLHTVCKKESLNA